MDEWMNRLVIELWINEWMDEWINRLVIKWICENEMKRRMNMVIN